MAVVTQRFTYETTKNGTLTGSKGSKNTYKAQIEIEVKCDGSNYYILPIRVRTYVTYGWRFNSTLYLTIDEGSKTLINIPGYVINSPSSIITGWGPWREVTGVAACKLSPTSKGYCPELSMTTSVKCSPSSFGGKAQSATCSTTVMVSTDIKRVFKPIDMSPPSLTVDGEYTWGSDVLSVAGECKSADCKNWMYSVDGKTYYSASKHPSTHTIVWDDPRRFIVNILNPEKKIHTIYVKATRSSNEKEGTSSVFKYDLRPVTITGFEVKAQSLQKLTVKFKAERACKWCLCFRRYDKERFTEITNYQDVTTGVSKIIPVSVNDSNGYYRIRTVSSTGVTYDSVESDRVQVGPVTIRNMSLSNLTTSDYRLSVTFDAVSDVYLAYSKTEPSSKEQAIKIINSSSTLLAKVTNYIPSGMTIQQKPKISNYNGYVIVAVVRNNPDSTREIYDVRWCKLDNRPPNIDILDKKIIAECNLQLQLVAKDIPCIIREIRRNKYVSRPNTYCSKGKVVVVSGIDVGTPTNVGTSLDVIIQREGSLYKDSSFSKTVRVNYDEYKSPTITDVYEFKSGNLTVCFNSDISCEWLDSDITIGNSLISDKYLDIKKKPTQLKVTLYNIPNGQDVTMRVTAKSTDYHSYQYFNKTYEYPSGLYVYTAEGWKKCAAYRKDKTGSWEPCKIFNGKKWVQFRVKEENDKKVVCDE